MRRREIVTPLLDRMIFLLAAVALVGSCGGSNDDVVAWCHRTTRAGSLTVSGSLTVCPAITAFTVVPQRLSKGQSAAISGTAVDLDSNNLSFTWSATAGTIADATQAETTYRCSGQGAVTLTLSVSDGTCHDDVDIPVDCVP